MRKARRLLALLMCLALLLGLFGCDTINPSSKALDEYTNAAQPLRNAQNLAIDLTTKKVIKAGTETFTLVSEQDVILTGIGTETFTASMVENQSIGNYRDKYIEYYEDGILYVNVYDAGYFQGDINEADFLSRFAPGVLLNEALYTNVSAEQTDYGVTLSFSDPADAEAWALPAGAEFLSSSGTARISDAGILTNTTYTIEYVHGNTTVSMEVSAKAEIYNGAAPAAPADPEIYKKIDSIDAPRLYDTAIQYLCSTETASSALNQTTICQAAGYVVSEEMKMHYSGTGKDHMSDIQYTSVSRNGSAAPTTFSQTEHFQDGVYTYKTGDGTSQPNASVTAEIMFNYLQEQYNSNLPALRYIISAKAEDIGGLIFLEMELDENWGQAKADDLANALFQDADFLNNYASFYKTTDSTYYMVLDSATGFPVSSGTTYSGYHKIDGTNYTLSSEIAQTYRLAKSDTYDMLAGETAPEVQATPLLYHVTGEAGQEMYLMGTIHVGDARTAFLPDEVYAALSQCDALAVEANIAEMEEELLADPELAAKYTEAYMNPFNDTTKRLLDSDVYDKAIKLLKAGGNYSSNTEHMKPFVWASSIENFYLTQGQLSAEKGMDMRLLELAKEQDKKIIEVESILLQLEMFSNFSTELQVLLLEEALNSNMAEYCNEAETLYELWCTGDEAELRKVMTQDISDLPDEERALYQEYLDAVIIQRNKNMLDKAIFHLKCGDTVFYAVGLAHLLQENGLVDTLREAGYTVEQVIYS